MDKFYQACYTRVGGADRNSGWKLTNTSADAPARMLNAFEQRQKGNEPVGRNTPRNAAGEFLCALEISCEADALALTRIQYGVPCHGREGSYSHGFLFPDAYELLKDPNRLLALSEDNFCFRGPRPDPEEALELYLQRTAQIPQSLTYGEPWTVERALERVGMRRGVYRKFVCCLYGSWAKSAKTTIYVKTDGTDEMAKALIYLAYAALPYSMRTRLGASTFPDAKNVTMVLTRELPDSCRYFDPVSGMHNVLTDNQYKRWNKMPFVSMLFEDTAPAFDGLERQLEEMGDRYSQDITMLQMACQMGLGGTDADPVDQLYDFLNIDLDFNEMMERKVAQRLDEVSRIVAEQGAAMSEDMEQLLDQRLNAALTEQLRSAGHRYKSARISRMDLDEGCRYLKGNPAFEVLRRNLQGTESGLQMLTEYYSREIDGVLRDPGCTYGHLVDCAAAFGDLRCMGDLWQRIFTAAGKLASEHCRRAVLGMRTGTAEAGEHTPLYLALEDYAAFARQIGKLGMLPAEERGDILDEAMRGVAQVTEEWLREYDKQFRRSFDPKRLGEYQHFYNREFPKPSILRYSALLLQKYLAAADGSIGVLMDFTDNGCLFDTYTIDSSNVRRRTRLEPASRDELELIERSLFAFWADSEKVRKNVWMWDVIRELDKDPRKKKNLQSFCEKDTQTFRFWERAARLQNKNMIWLMLEKKAVLILAEGMLERSLRYNERYWTEEQLSSSISQCDACARDGKSEAKEIREVLANEQRSRLEAREEFQRLLEKNQREREKDGKRTAKQEKKAEKQAEKQAEQTEKQAQKQAARAARRDLQPGTPNKFTEEAPGGYVPVKPSRAKQADPDETDSVLGFLGVGHSAPAPEPEDTPGANLADPLPKPEETEKSGERGGFLGLFRKRRS